MKYTMTGTGCNRAPTKTFILREVDFPISEGGGGGGGGVGHGFTVRALVLGALSVPLALL